MPKTVNGIGTTYLGSSNRQPDGSFVTTEWFVLFSVPIIPLKSQRVKYLSAHHGWSGSTNMYSILGPAPLDSKLVLTAYAWIVIPLILMSILILLLNIFIPNGSSGYTSILTTIMLVMVIAPLIFWLIIFPSIYKAK